MDLTLHGLYQKLLNNMSPTHWWPADSKQQIIIEAILIQNTTERNAEHASQLIKEATGYDFKKISGLPAEILEKLIRPAGFMKNKSRAIRTVTQWYLDHNQNSQIIAKEYGEDLRSILLKIHGVGPETADVFLTYIFDRPQFIADKYARTLFAQLGIQRLTDYNSLAKLLSALPEPFTYQDAQEFHGLIDEFGKKYLRRKNFEHSFLAGDRLILPED